MIKVNGQEIKLTKFPNGETLVDTSYLNTLVNEEKVRIDFKYFEDADILHLYFVLKHLDKNCTFITKKKIYIYYMPYSRMDRSENGCCFTLQHIIALLHNCTYVLDEFYIIEPHSNKTTDLLRDAKRINVITPLMQKILKEHPEIDMICYPDKGAKARFQDDSVTLPVVYCNKVRDFDTGEIKGLELDGETDVKGKNILILDDLCSKGGTFYHTANKLKENGANDIYLGVCHMEYTVEQGELLKPDSPIEHIYCMDTMLDYSLDYGKITIYDIEKFLNENILEEV